MDFLLCAISPKSRFNWPLLQINSTQNSKIRYNLLRNHMLVIHLNFGWAAACFLGQGTAAKAVATASIRLQIASEADNRQPTAETDDCCEGIVLYVNCTDEVQRWLLTIHAPLFNHLAVFGIDKGGGGGGWGGLTSTDAADASISDGSSSCCCSSSSSLTVDKLKTSDQGSVPLWFSYQNQGLSWWNLQERDDSSEYITHTEILMKIWSSSTLLTYQYYRLYLQIYFGLLMWSRVLIYCYNLMLLLVLS